MYPDDKMHVIIIEFVSGKGGTFPHFFFTKLLIHDRLFAEAFSKGLKVCRRENLTKYKATYNCKWVALYRYMYRNIVLCGLQRPHSLKRL